MKRHLLLLIAVAGALASARVAPAQRVAAPAQPAIKPAPPMLVTSRPAPEVVQQLVQQLGSRDWQQREDAAGRLMGLGPGAYEGLIRAYSRSTRFERRIRIKEIASAIFLAERFPPKTGFLGIRQQPAPASFDPATGKSRMAIRVLSVVPGTAAEKARLQPGDLLVKFNGKDIPRDTTGRVFSAMVGGLPPKARVTMQIIRGNQQGKITVTLGSRPMRHQTPEVKAVARELWTNWWQSTFESPTLPAPD